jgi:SET and MYND domain-containing protein
MSERGLEVPFQGMQNLGKIFTFQTLRMMLRVLRRLQFEKVQGKESNISCLSKLISHISFADAETRNKYAQMTKLVLDCLRFEQKTFDFTTMNMPYFIELFCKFEINNYNILNKDMQPVAAGLYLMASTLNHSCCPNAVVVFEGPRLLLRSTKTIQSGEEVTISYVDIACSTQSRLKELQDRYHFHCTCPMCIDVSGERDKMLLNTFKPLDANANERLSVVKECLVKGEALCRACNFSEAFLCYNRAYQLQKGLMIPINLCLFSILNGLVQCCIECDDFSSAFDHCQHSIPFYEYIYGDNHPMLALQLFTLGKLAWFMEKPVLTQIALMRARRIYLITHGEQHSIMRPLNDLLSQSANAVE